jgi:D-glycero-D-manno-heptose 1,7-bisphosphate phosphatase
MRRAAVFMDRDGVINRAFVRGGVPHPPDSVDALEILPHVPQALNSLKAQGYSLIVVTNQPDVARGSFSLVAVERIHRRLESELTLDAIFTCFHDCADGCDCRKPRPGLLLKAAQALGIDLSSSFMVGDRSSDMEAGRRAGCSTLFVDYGGYGEAPPPHFDFRVGSLLEASRIILKRTASSIACSAAR